MMVIRFLVWVACLCAALFIALIPETVMYFVYHLIQPQSDVARAILLVAFWFFGAGACVAFGAVGIWLGLAMTVAVLE